MKKQMSAVLAAVAVLMSVILASESAFAHGRGGRIGISIGVPLVGFGYHSYYSPYYYPPYNYYPGYYPPYYPSPMVIQQQAPVYVEQGNAAPAQPQQPQQLQPEQQGQSQGFWYNCAGAGGYYPYVKECPAGWQRVAPQPN